MKICLTGGGTAGHISPNLALLPEIRKYFDKIIYIGGINSMEKKMLKNEKDVKFYEIHTAKLVRKSIFKNIKLPFNLIKGILDSKKILKAERPDVIFCKGGYVSVPVMIAAKQQKIPLFCHESDLSLGLANKIVSKYALKTFTSFKETSQNIKSGVYSGPIIKKEIIMQTKTAALKNLNIKTSKPVLLITGGSLGAKKINDTIFSCIDSLTKDYYVLHIIGKTHPPNIKNNNYKVISFTDHMEDYIAAADYIVSRAGSNTIFELLLKQKPMLLIPLKKGSRGDQIENAKLFESKGFCMVLDEDNLNNKSLINNLNKLKNSADKIIKNQSNYNLPNGTDVIMHHLKNVILQNKKA